MLARQRPPAFRRNHGVIRTRSGGCRVAPRIEERARHAGPTVTEAAALPDALSVYRPA